MVWTAMQTVFKFRVVNYLYVQFENQYKYSLPDESATLVSTPRNGLVSYTRRDSGDCEELEVCDCSDFGGGESGTAGVANSSRGQRDASAYATRVPLLPLAAPLLCDGVALLSSRDVSGRAAASIARAAIFERLPIASPAAAEGITDSTMASTSSAVTSSSSEPALPLSNALESSAGAATAVCEGAAVSATSSHKDELIAGNGSPEVVARPTYNL